MPWENPGPSSSPSKRISPAQGSGQWTNVMRLAHKMTSAYGTTVLDKRSMVAETVTGTSKRIENGLPSPPVSAGKAAS